MGTMKPFSEIVDCNCGVCVVLSNGSGWWQIPFSVHRSQFHPHMSMAAIFQYDPFSHSDTVVDCNLSQARTLGHSGTCFDGEGLQNSSYSITSVSSASSTSLFPPFLPPLPPLSAYSLLSALIPVQRVDVHTHGLLVLLVLLLTGLELARELLESSLVLLRVVALQALGLL